MLLMGQILSLMSIIFTAETKLLYEVQKNFFDDYDSE